MTRRVVCTKSDQFDVCYLAIHLGRILVMNDAQGKQSREDRRKDLAILRALKACSDEAPDEQVDGKPKFPKLPTGDAQRVVHADAVLDFSQMELDRLSELINRVAWDTSKIEMVEDTLDWLAAADKVDEGLRAAK